MYKHTVRACLVCNGQQTMTNYTMLLDRTVVGTWLLYQLRCLAPAAPLVMLVSLIYTTRTHLHLVVSHPSPATLHQVWETESPVSEQSLYFVVTGNTGVFSFDMALVLRRIVFPNVCSSTTRCPVHSIHILSTSGLQSAGKIPFPAYSSSQCAVLTLHSSAPHIPPSAGTVRASGLLRR